jgi:hypothetical protein
MSKHRLNRRRNTVLQTSPGSRPPDETSSTALAEEQDNRRDDYRRNDQNPNPDEVRAGATGVLRLLSSDPALARQAA